ncbi:MAG: type II toxin-antitoxin system death-on-curing family toxin [Treponema sp.]|nr:type II toxin-antitoxin system death-on-curing family toxin [Treponema sp.]
MKRLSKRQILAMHRALADASGGTCGVRDDDLLDSALAQPFQTFGGKELYPSVHEKAARLAFGIAKNHSLVDGNKRLAAHVALVFLAVNGMWLRYTQKELSDLFWGVADGTVSAEKLSLWLRNHIVDWAAKEQKFDKFGLIYARHYSFEHWYDKDGNIIHHRDKYGERWHEYDERGNAIHSIYHLKSEEDSEEWCEYDAAGNKVQETVVQGGVVRKYDANGNVVHCTYSDGREEWREYDANGNEVHYRDSNGEEEWVEYDDDGNEVHRKDSNGYERWREYDANGKEVHRKDSNGEEKWWKYDANGKEVYYKDSDGKEIWTEYDDDGNEVFQKVQRCQGKME